MRPYSSVERAFAALAHPVTLLAALVLVINARWLQPFAPSWLSGKLGDAAGMLFLPLLVALTLACVWRGGAPRRIGGLALGASALFWIAFKTLAPFNAFVVARVPVKGTLDASDVLVLAVLPVTWWLWTRAVYHVRPNALWKTGALSLLALSLLADAPAPPEELTRRAETAAARAPTETLQAGTRQALAPTRAAETQRARATALPRAGVICLRVQDDAVVAGTFAYDFRSVDGGLTWTQSNTAPRADAECNQRALRDTRPTGVRDPYRPGIVYYFDWSGLRRWDETTRTMQTEFKPDPAPEYYDALVERATGNVILAAGTAGVLVRTPDAQWRFVAVGEFQRE
jgi:hypothetical protein